MLIKTHKLLIYKVANSYCSDIDEQEDLIQEIIYQLIKSYSRFDHRVKITTWMYKVALNVAITHYRKLKTRQKYFIPIHEKLVRVYDSPEQLENEHIIKLRGFVQKLDPLNKAIMIMYLDGNSHTDIAEAMGITVTNVGTKISRIKHQLKKKFNQEKNG